LAVQRLHLQSRKRWCYADAHCHADAYSDRNTNSVAYCDTNPNSNPHSDANCYTDTDSYAYSYSQSDVNADSDTYTNSVSNSYTAHYWSCSDDFSLTRIDLHFCQRDIYLERGQRHKLRAVCGQLSRSV
jgi:hypothetical protein